MNPKTIIAELRHINRWRRGDKGVEQPDLKHFGEVMDAAADTIGRLIASNTTLRRERGEARAEVAQLNGALALGQENCDAEYEALREERDEAKADLLAYQDAVDAQPWATDEPIRVLLDRVTTERDEMRKRIYEIQQVERPQDTRELTAIRARVAELEAALLVFDACIDELITDKRGFADAAVAARNSQFEHEHLLLAARADFAAPAKHTDTERSVKRSRKLNGLAAWLEHEADVRKACATNEGDRWYAGRMSECAEAIREYASSKQGGGA